MAQIQPCDWQDTDVNFKYTVDVYGRTADKEVVRVRITGFQPYFYLKSCEGETPEKIRFAISNACQKRLSDMKITHEMKLDAMSGFCGLNPIAVWKLTFPAIWMFKVVAKTLKGLSIGNRIVRTEDVYEANLPPLLRFFHDLNINPASPIQFEGDEEDPEDDTIVDICYTVHYQDVKPCDVTIPLYIAAYDIETYSESGKFPVSTNPADEIIQIGVSFRSTNDMLTSKKRYVFVSGTCEPSGNSDLEFVSCKNERDLLRKFEQCIQEENPDIIAGYNTFGFDDGYIADRAAYNKINLQFGRYDYTKWKSDYVKTEKKTFELASGKFAVRYIEMAGRLPVDLLLSVRREQNLDSYKLDNVASTFLRDKVINIVEITGEKTQQTEIHTKSTRGLFPGNLVRFDIVTNTVNPYRNGQKFYVKEVFPKKFIVELPQHNYLFDELEGDDKKRLEWSFTKDDITAKDMFASHRGTPADRSVVAKYCIQDCDLVLTLMAKLDTLVNARGMADVCRVPIQYIFLRGQGIKIYSAVVYNAAKRNQIIMAQDGLEEDTSYEGAIVLPPKIGMYLDQPIPVLDFNSLYPSNMIAFNLSPDTLLFVKTYDMSGKLLKHEGRNASDYPNYKVDEVSYDLKNDDGKSVGRVVCGYVQPTDDSKTIGLLPLSLDILLKKRKETRKKMESVDDDAQKSVLNGLQLAYKVVANSVYGQCGSKTSPIRKFEVAASTTAVGRQKIYDAKAVVVSEFGAEVIYGDSVASYTPLFLRINGEDVIMIIEELGRLGEWKRYNDKEYCELNGVESWTEAGWTPVDRVIRHKLASHKKMIRIFAGESLVDVSDDHSLLLPNGTAVSPKDVRVGMTLLHSTCPNTMKCRSVQEFYLTLHQLTGKDIKMVYVNRNSSNTNCVLVNHLILSTLVHMAHQVGLYAVITPYTITQSDIILPHLKFDSSVSYINVEFCSTPSSNVITHKIEIPYEGYVYDLTTSNHHFQAGVGTMIVHNTDSIFVKFPTKDLLESMNMARKAAERITSLCRKAHKIEYEKTFYPFILFSRKRYVGMMYEDDPTKCKRKSMGIALKRRDNAPIVKDIYGGALDILLEHRDIRKAQEFVQNMLVQVLKNEVPLEKFIVTKQLRDDYKNPDQIAHRVLADRMEERDPGNAPQVGDRLPYVYVDARKDAKKQGDKIEHVDYVKEKGLKPDTEFYITNQIQNPVAQLFALALEDLDGYVERVDYKRLLEETIDAGGDEEESTISILKQKEKELETLLFMGSQYLRKLKRGPIDRYFQRTRP